MIVFSSMLTNIRSHLMRPTRKLVAWWKDTVKKFSALRKPTSAKFHRKSSASVSSTGYAKFYTYDSIPLSLFVEIVNTGNYNLIAKDKYSPDECYEAWEIIIQKNSEHTQDTSFNQQLSIYKSYCRLVNDYVNVTTNLMRLLFVVDDSMIKELAAYGYKIDTSNNLLYTKSISECLIRSKNLLSKITMRKNEIETISKKAYQKHELSFSELIANISFSLGSVGVNISIDNNITLAMYNEYRKLIQKKVEVIKRSNNGL